MRLLTHLIQEACDDLGLSYRLIADNDSFLEIDFHGKKHFILNGALGLNRDSDLSISKDKSYTYQLLSSVIPMPQTKSYIDPNTFYPYDAYTTFSNETEILSDILSTFPLPVIVKRNSGKQGENVFLCHTEEDVQNAIKKIYSKKQIEYDHILLAETYVQPKREFRVIILGGNVELVYHKDNSQADFSGNLSPLHWKHAVSHVVTEPELLQRIQSMVTTLYTKFAITYAGLDIVEAIDGSLWLIEVNSTPQLGEFAKTNDPERFKTIFTKGLRLLEKRYMQLEHCPSA